MYKIVNKRELTDNIFLMDIEAPRVAKSAKPGQFIIIKNNEKGERIPLTIADYNKEDGTVNVFAPRKLNPVFVLVCLAE